MTIQRKANVSSKGSSAVGVRGHLGRIADDVSSDAVVSLRMYLKRYRRPSPAREHVVRPVRPAVHRDLQLANETLDNISIAALEFGIAAPSRDHVDRVRQMLADLHRNVPRRYASYLMPDGQIAIDIRNTESKNGIFIKVGSDKTVTCLNDTQDNQKTVLYQPSDGFPDETVFETIRKLDSETAR